MINPRLKLMLNLLGWDRYGEESQPCGKWFYFFNPADVVQAKIWCQKAIADGVCREAKHTSELIAPSVKQGVCCFYAPLDDIDAQARLLLWMIKHGLIQRTGSGKLYNMPFQYGEDRKVVARVIDFVNPMTGEPL